MSQAVFAEAEDDALLDKASKLSGLNNTHEVITKALQYFVQKLEFEQDKRELYDHIEEGIDDIANGQVITEDEFYAHMDAIVGRHV
jgi:predicted transcriptional regulator